MDSDTVSSATIYPLKATAQRRSSRKDESSDAFESIQEDKEQDNVHESQGTRQPTRTIDLMEFTVPVRVEAPPLRGQISESPRSLPRRPLDRRYRRGAPVIKLSDPSRTSGKLLRVIRQKFTW
jgi:hypothetical protein